MMVEVMSTSQQEQRQQQQADPYADHLHLIQPRPMPPSTLDDHAALDISPPPASSPLTGPLASPQGSMLCNCLSMSMSATTIMDSSHGTSLSIGRRKSDPGTVAASISQQEKWVCIISTHELASSSRLNYTMPMLRCVITFCYMYATCYIWKMLMCTLLEGRGSAKMFCTLN